ncbi:hypothetical protein F443_00364 [Phytophthora nicotianae P1569]|uniref:Tc1-like transposase DDE domain-containing protein n=2 Tax=Phytophthora nicotianae TaxID=4792 RepID=V9G2F0_PHYNI|nr:hypothetical protein F443_00364 [Phytophthora nicotianae P1569]ETO86060.1 hypothetical protein F444_00350 [Phytophthora nicotianae P1976]
MTDGKLPRGCINNAAAHFGCTRQTVSSVFHARDEKPCESARGIARVWTPGAILEVLEAVPAIERTPYRALVAATGIPRPTLARAKPNKDGIRRATGSVKPYLTSDQTHQHIEFALSFVEEGAGTYRFNSMNDTIHIDEKWFYISKKRKAYYLTDNEEVPHFAVPNVNHLTKVPFLVAVGRPRYDPHSRTWFDGKLGCWLFVEMVEAQRSSKNRPADTPELKCT